jgi:hypothetical protein
MGLETKEPGPEKGVEISGEALKIEDLQERVGLLLKRHQQLSYSVSALQGDAARRRRLEQDLGLIALGFYVGLVVACIIVYGGKRL